MEQKLYDLKKLHEITMEDEAFIQDMLIAFVENATTETEAIKTLKSAEDWHAIAEKAHKLASNFAYLNAVSLQKQASDIERSVINERNFTGIADKTDRLYHDAILLIEQLKQDFDFLSTK